MEVGFHLHQMMLARKMISLSKMNLKNFNRGKEAELSFAKQYLKDYEFSNKEQDMFEHWDVKGTIFGSEYKFDVKALKRNSRDDPTYKNDSTWVEGTNVLGNKGWLKGEADYIVFERIENWLMIHRAELLEWTLMKLRENNFEQGKGFYKIYQRQQSKDKITLIKYDDVPDSAKVYLPKI